MTTRKNPASPRAAAVSKSAPQWELHLYVARGAPRSNLAISNLERICEEYGPGRYRIRIVDVLSAPERCRQDQIVAVPTVVRRLPLPERRVIGTLADQDRAAQVLDLAPAGKSSGTRKHIGNKEGGEGEA